MNLNILLIFCFHCFRIHLERVTSATIVPQAVLEKEAQGNLELQELQKNFAGQKDAEEYTFGWQDKVFCQVK